MNNYNNFSIDSFCEDNFKFDNDYKLECMKWLNFIDKEKNRLESYIPRFTQNVDKIYEVLAEIKSAYFLEKRLGYKIIDFNAKTIKDKDVDFLMINNKNEKIYCEVNCPNFLTDFPINERKSRKKLPKYINGEIIKTDTARDIKTVIDKKYNKFFPNELNLLIIVPNKIVYFLDWPRSAKEKALYSIYGYFSNSLYKKLSGLLILEFKNISYDFSKMEYEYIYEYYPNYNSNKLLEL